MYYLSCNGVNNSDSDSNGNGISDRNINGYSDSGSNSSSNSESNSDSNSTNNSVTVIVTCNGSNSSTTSEGSTSDGGSSSNRTTAVELFVQIRNPKPVALFVCLFLHSQIRKAEHQLLQQN